MTRYCSFALTVAALLALASVGLAQGTCIDFDGLADEDLITNQFAGVTFSSTQGFENRVTMQFLGSSPPNFLCTFTTTLVIACIAPTLVEFNPPVNNLSFNAVGDSNIGLSGTVDVFESGSYSGTVDIIGDGTSITAVFVDLSGFSMVTRIELDPSPDPAGLGFDDFCFDADPTCDDGGTFGNYCIATPFSTGLPSTISANQSSVSIAGNDLVLSANNLPAQPGQFIGAQAAAQVPFMNGFLCVESASLQRLLPITFADAAGFTTIAVEFTNGAQTPTGSGPVNVVAGTTHYFQRWNRDPGTVTGSNLSNGIGICITP